MLFLLQCSFFAWLLVCAPKVVGMLGPSTGVALAAGLLTAAAAWACRQAGAPALVTLGFGAVVVGAAALGAAIAIGHPLGLEVRRALTRSGP